MASKCSPISATLVALFIATLSPPSFAIPGDVNGDGVITVQDAILCLRIAGGLYNPTRAEFSRADVRPYPYDGKVTVIDALATVQWALGSGARPIPGGALLGRSLTFPVTGNATVNAVMPSGFTVSGRIFDGAFTLPGQVALINGNSVGYGPAARDATGIYHVNVPSGTYTPMCISSERTTNASGEDSFLTQSYWAGDSYPVGSDLYGKDVTVPQAPDRSTLTFTLGQFALYQAWWTPREMYLDGSYFNSVRHDMNAATCVIPAPEDYYRISGYGLYMLNDGFQEDAYLSHYAPGGILDIIDVTQDASYTFNLPGMNHVTAYPGGAQIYAAGLDPIISAATSGTVTCVSRWQDPSESIALAAAPGDYVFWFAVPAPGHAECYAEYDTTMRWFPYSWSQYPYASVPMPAFRTVTGVLTAPSGTPVSNAIVTAKSIRPDPVEGDFEAWYFEETAMTDLSGRYTLTIPEGAYTVWASPGY